MSDFSRGLDEIWKKSGDLDHKEFTMEVIKLHEDEIAKVKNFVPIGTEQFNFLFRLLALPFVIIGSVVWCIIFIFSSNTFGRLLVRTGEGFLKKNDVASTDIPDENEQGK